MTTCCQVLYLTKNTQISLVSPGRPIVTSSQCPAEIINAFGDSILKPLVMKTPTYICATKDFLCQAKSVPKLPPGALLVTMEVVGLYTNIPHTEGIAAVRTALADCPDGTTPPLSDIIKLVEHILSLDCFIYKGQHYHQQILVGTAMDTCMAPSYANLLMVQQDLLRRASNNTPEFLKRFIDDLFMILLHGEENLQHFFTHANSLSSHIKFTLDYGQIDQLRIHHPVQGVIGRPS